MSVGIESLNAYCGIARIPVRAFFEHRDLDERRYANLMMRERSVQLPWEDPVTNAVNAARPLLDAMDADQRANIGMLITASESGLDYSKSIASYVHEYLRLSRHCRTFEVKQACYGATGAMQLAAGYLAAGFNPELKALIIATDTNPMDERAQYAEPATGHGAVAMIIGPEPGVLVLEPGRYGACSFEIMDTARPQPDFDLYNVDASLLSYLECLVATFTEYRSRTGGADYLESFDYLAMHTPFAGMAKAAHRKMMREFAPRSQTAIDADFESRLLPSLDYAMQVGNLCSGSLYLAIASLITSVPAASLKDARLGLFSYGSGCAAEFFPAVVADGAAKRLMAQDISGRLRRRRLLSFDQYLQVMPAARSCLMPRQTATIDLAECDDALSPFSESGPHLVLSGIKDYHREYEWRWPS